MNPTRGVLFFFFPQQNFSFSKAGPRVSDQVSLWPNWIRRLTTNQKIGGSSPNRDTFLFSTRGTKSRRGSPTAARRSCLAWMPEWSKGADLRSAGRFVRVGSNPTPGKILLTFCVCETVLCYGRIPFFLCLHGLMDKAHPS